MIEDLISTFSSIVTLLPIALASLIIALADIFESLPTIKS
jgi:hypothetical protein